jgi:tetratricopeptide (TPR) repeat protein
MFQRQVVAADQQWLRVSSDHFSVLTDAGQKRGHEIIARFEQMRSIFGQLLMRNKIRMAEPLEIIAIGNANRYAALAPLLNGSPIPDPGFFLPGEDRVFVVLNASDPDCWRAVEHQLAHYFLNFNYPPTQPWFDEGFAEYFSAIDFTPKKVELGSDPELSRSRLSSSFIPASTSANDLKSFTEILESPVWLNLTDLLEMKNRVINGQEGTHHTLFYAQSWILVHYLLNQNKLPEAGTYFDLVENRRMPVAQAIQQAFQMTPLQLDQALKAYFHSLKPLATALDESKQANPPPTPEPVTTMPLPFTVDDVSASVKALPVAEGQALLDEMELRIPEHREQAITDLEKLADDPHSENVIEHRALAWADTQKGDTDRAFEELEAAMQINSTDPFTRLGLALAAYHSGQNGAHVRGLANTMESLQFVLNEYPDFAEAYNILGWARLQGGGANAALEAMKLAVQLNPRREDYQLRYAEAFMAARKWDEATALFDRLKSSQNPQIAAAAKKDLRDVPYLKKFGIPPQEDAGAKTQTTTPPDKPQMATNQSAPDASSDESSNDEHATKGKPAAPQPDRRPVRFLKGTLLSVDCSNAPTAVLNFSSHNKTLRLRAADYKSVAVIGAGEFSCTWKKVAAAVNYRPGGTLDGDLVSVEVQ